MNNSNFNRVGLIGRQRTPQIDDSLRAVYDVLVAYECELLVENTTAELIDKEGIHVVERADLANCDLLVVVGGDGSILSVARDLAHTNIPVLGVNRGGLGFLADISPDQIEPRVEAVLQGKYRTENRFLLHVEVERNGELVHESPALNDVVVSAQTLFKMMEFRLSVNGEFVYDQRSDGLLVSSPTGSTAYSLSAGGPIMHPDLDAIAIIPMFPHTLTARPIVVAANSKITVTISANEPGTKLSSDSQVEFNLKASDQVNIKRYAHSLNLIHPSTHSFYEACRSKLDWASRLGGSVKPR